MISGKGLGDIMVQINIFGKTSSCFKMTIMFKIMEIMYINVGRFWPLPHPSISNGTNLYAARYCLEILCDYREGLGAHSGANKNLMQEHLHFQNDHYVPKACENLIIFGPFWP